MFEKGNQFRFKPGQSGNPKGNQPIRERLTCMTQKALDNLTDSLNSDDVKERIWATQYVLDQVMGRAPVSITGANGEPLVLGPQINIANISIDDMRQLAEIRKRLLLGAVSSGDNDGSIDTAADIAGMDPKSAV